jgi:hypothetical protein
MAITSKEINLSQLDKELGCQGLIGDFNDPENKIIKPADNSTITENELKSAIDVHVAFDEVKANAKAKADLLLRLGISEEEVKLLLS